MSDYEQGLKDGVSAQEHSVLSTVSVRAMLEYLEGVGEHFNREPFDRGYQFKIVFEGLLRGHGTTGLKEVSEEILSFRRDEQ